MSGVDSHRTSGVNERGNLQKRRRDELIRKGLALLSSENEATIAFTEPGDEDGPSQRHRYEVCSAYCAAMLLAGSCGFGSRV